MDEKTLYDRVYLCRQKIGGFECKQFKTFDDAENYSRTTINEYPNRETKECNYVLPTKGICSTMIPFYRYTPTFMDKHILNWKLYNMTHVKIVNKYQDDKQK